MRGCAVAPLQSHARSTQRTPIYRHQQEDAFQNRFELLLPV
jgi:hypothetical protein